MDNWQITNETEADPIFAAPAFFTYRCPKCGAEHAFTAEADVECPCDLVFTVELFDVAPVVFRLWFNPLQFVTVPGYVKEA